MTNILFQLVVFIAIVSIGLNVIYWPYLKRQYRMRTEMEEKSQDDTSDLYNGNAIIRYPSFDDEIMDYSRRLDDLTTRSDSS